MSAGGEVPGRLAVDAPGAQRAARNSLVSLFRGVLTVPLNLITTAVLLSRAGADALGLWAILLVFTNPITGFYFGLSWSLARKVPHHRSDPAALTRWVSSCASVYAGLIAALALAFLVVRGDLAAWLATRSAVAPGEIARALDLSVVSLLVLACGFPLGALLFGMEEIPAIQTAVVAHQVVITGLQVLLVAPGAGAAAIFGPALAGSVVQVAFQLAAVRRILGHVPLAASAVRAREARALVSEAVGISLFEAFQLSFYHVDKWLVAAFLGTGPVGYYELGVRVAMTARAVLNTVCLAIFSSVANAAASPLAAPKLARLFHYALRYLVLVSLPLVVACGLYAPRLLTLWVGRAEAPAVLALTLLVPSYVCNALSTGMLFLLLGEGRTRPVLAFSGANLLLSWTLAGLAIGLTGSFSALVAASLGASALSTAALLVYFASVRRLVSPALAWSGGRLLAAAALFGAAVALIPEWAVSSTAGLALDLALRVGVLLAADLALLFALGEADEQDRYFLAHWRGIVSDLR
jgi:O-antigen/teichoic acid export membrane protein